MLTPTVFELKFDLDRPIEFKAGQFASIVIPKAGPSGRDLRRAYSIASPPEFKHIELCIKIVPGGPGTSFLHTLKPDDSFRCFGPYGDFVYKTALDRHACFVATGTGISPFRAIILSKRFKENPPLSATCLIGVREENELLYLKELQDNPDVKLVCAVTRPTQPNSFFHGRVTDYFRSITHTMDWTNTDFYLCGNGGMITEVKQILFERGVKKEAIFQEIYYKPSENS